MTNNADYCEICASTFSLSQCGCGASLCDKCRESSEHRYCPEDKTADGPSTLPAFKGLSKKKNGQLARVILKSILWHFPELLEGRCHDPDGLVEILSDFFVNFSDGGYD